jgi:hypothetical protein
MFQTIYNYLWGTSTEFFSEKPKKATKEIKEIKETKKIKEEIKEAKEEAKEVIKEEELLEDVASEPNDHRDLLRFATSGISVDEKPEEPIENPSTGKLILKKFDLKMMENSVNILALGKRGVGKTTLLTHIKDKLALNHGLIFAPLCTVQQYKNYGNDTGISLHSRFDSQILENFLRDDQNMLETVVITDDCDFNIWKDENIRWLIMNGRHIKTSLLTSFHCPMGIPPDIRTNFDYIFMFREKNESSRHKLYEHYAGMFPSYALFEEAFDKCTDNYSCMVINNTSRSHKLEDQVFWYEVH